MKDIGRSILKGSKYFFIFSVLSAFTGYFFRFLLVRNLSLQDFGLFYSVFALIGFLSLFKDLGLGSTLTKFVSEFKTKMDYDKVKSSFVYILLFQVSSVIILSLLLFILKNYLVNNYFQDPRAWPLLLILIGWFLLSTFHDAIFFLFLGLQMFFVYSLRELLKTLLPLLFLLVFLFFGFSQNSPAFSYLFGSIITLIIVLPLLFSKFKFSRYKIVRSASFVKDIALFSIPIFLSTAGGLVISYTDTLMLTFFKSLEEVGIYNIILPTSMLFLIFAKSVGTVFYPISSSLWANNKRRMISDYMSMIYKYSFMLILPFALVLLFFSELFLSFFFGPEYAVGSNAFRVLVIGMIFFGLAIINNSTINGIGKPKEVTKIMFQAVIINVLLNLLLIPLFGFMGAAIATSCSYLIIFVLGTRVFSNIVRVKVPLLSWLKTLAGSLVFFLVLFILKRILVLNPWLEFIILSLIGFACYILTLFLMKAVSVKEVISFSRMIIKNGG